VAFGKSYETAEEYNFRKGMFAARFEQIISHNSQNDALWVSGVNQFTDLTEEEFNQYKGFIPSDEEPFVEAEVHDHALQQSSPVDWRGYLGAARNQGSCGSCWAFAAIGAIEGRIAQANGSRTPLSEQHLVDCSTVDGGCQGGNPINTFPWIARTNSGALYTLASYPYVSGSTRTRGSCRVATVGGRIRGGQSYTNMLSALSSGPIVIALQGDSGFGTYKSGIYDGYCGNPDHAVVAVGWGSASGVNYWIIRNSWGTGFGENGHIRIKMNGNCRVFNNAYPIV